MLCHAFPEIFEDYFGVVARVGRLPTGGTTIKSIDCGGDSPALSAPPIEMKMLSVRLDFPEGTYFVEPPTKKEARTARTRLCEIVPPELKRFIPHEPTT